MVRSAAGCRVGARAGDLGPPEFHKALDLIIRNEYTLQSGCRWSIRRLEEHIAATEQSFGARLVEDHAAVGVRCHGERDARREVRFDQARYHIYRGTLRG